MNVKKNILVRVYVSFLCVGALALAVIVQMLRLQTVKAPQLRAMADSFNTKYVNIDAIRGNVYAADGSLLSTSIPIYELRMDMNVESMAKKFFDDNVDSLAWCLSTYFGDKTAQQYKAELKHARAKKSRYFFIQKGLTFSQVKDIKKFPIFRLGKYKGGLIVREDSRRIQPFGKLAFRTIGYTRRDVKPVGIEGAFNGYLSGTAGKRLMQRAPGGDYIPVNKDNEIDPEDGKDIYTTLDVNFQDITEDALEKVLRENKAEHGCAIVMEVATGHVKAIANLTRQGDEGDYVEKYNYAIGEATEPGSTFKLVSLISLLEDHKATPETQINIEGGQTRFFDRVMKDAHGGRDMVTLKQGFELSSNVAMSKAVYQAYSKTPSMFTNHIHLLKLDEPLGLPIHGEGKPRIKTPKSPDWYGTSLPWMSIGYELQITPLQTLTLYNAIANNGVMVKPMFVTEIRETGKPVRTWNTEVINPKICSDNTLTTVRQFLEGVVEEGTATNIKNDLYKIAGKTGTAQVANDGNYQTNKKYQASFVGYFPANKPMYSIIVVINNPTNGVYYGASVSGPVFKEISDKIYAWTSSTHSYLAALNPQDEKLPVKGGINQGQYSTLVSLYKDKPGLQLPPAEDIWIKPVLSGNTVQPKDIEIKTQTVPDVMGMTLADALFLLENNGLQVRISGKGKVAYQSLPPGSTYRSPQTIQINLN